MLRLQLLGYPKTLLGERHVQGFVHIVDDDALFRRAMERRLKHACYEVASYASAQQLLDHLPSESVPSCILLDVQLPELSGPELQTRLSELGSILPIIFLTGHPDIQTTVQAIKSGADDFLTKPIPLMKTQLNAKPTLLVSDVQGKQANSNPDSNSE